MKSTSRGHHTTLAAASNSPWIEGPSGFIDQRICDWMGQPNVEIDHMIYNVVTPGLSLTICREQWSQIVHAENGRPLYSWRLEFYRVWPTGARPDKEFREDD